jgi:hypothetical protein
MNKTAAEKIVDAIITDLFNKGYFDFCTDQEEAEAEKECRESWTKIINDVLSRDAY